MQCPEGQSVVPGWQRLMQALRPHHGTRSLSRGCISVIPLSTATPLVLQEWEFLLGVTPRDKRDIGWEIDLINEIYDLQEP